MIVADTTYDYIIVGGGVAGLTLASRLSKLLPDASILVIEAGDDPSSNPDVKHAGGMANLATSQQAWHLQFDTEEHMGGRNILTYAGKALGGSAAVNLGAWTRGPASDYNLWAEIAGDKGWAYDSMLPFFKLTEADDREDATPGHHGKEGHIQPSVAKDHRHYPLFEDVKKVCEQASIPRKTDLNDGQPLGVSNFVDVWGRGTGARPLPYDILDLSRVSIEKNAMVQRVVISRQEARLPRASGVELIDGKVYAAKREVIVSAGSYFSPQILLLSGIGPSTHLAEHSIDPVVNNAAVGANMSDHLMTWVTLRLHADVAARGLVATHSDFQKDPARFNGALSDSICFGSLGWEPKGGSSETLSKLNTSPRDRALVCRSDACHYEIVPTYTPYPMELTGVKNDISMSPEGRHFSVVAGLLTSTSRGSVRLRSASINDRPLLKANFQSTESDRAIMRQVLRKAVGMWTETEHGRSLVEAEEVPEGFEPIKPETRDEDIDRRIAQFGLSMWHPMGTCRMAKASTEEVGEEDGGVVDAKCRVFGVEGLRVVDASVVPVPMAAHTQACIYALAERMASVIAEDAK
jgi:choline dehydrogenase-like flavoprotein